jgi:chemotaxis protein methyltransferase CheR
LTKRSGSRVGGPVSFAEGSVRDEAGSEGAAPRSGLHARLEEEAYRGLRTLVLAAGGIDLNRYKDRCVLRRIAVRQRASGAADLRAYLRLVGRDPVEREHLVKALTIHVSQFLRNPTTFRAIQTEVLPAILADKARMGGRALRLWSVGCACGEEPIYGTDIEPECLRVAREARYPAISLKSVPTHWKQQYFTPVGLDYEVRPEIRRLVYFKLHSILDPVPFGRIDLVVFRNVLIYMTDPLQEQVLLRLSESLNVGGYLVLGKVEGLAGSARELFEPVNVPERIYRKRGDPASERRPRGLEALWK